MTSTATMEGESSGSSSRMASPARDVIMEDGEEDESWMPPDQEILDSYNSLMSDRLPTIKPPTISSVALEEPTTIANPDGTVRPMTKAEKQNAKKKRRKERERDEKALAVQQERAELKMAQLAKPVEFRLFSSCPVKQVSILPPVEDYPTPNNPRHDTLPQSKLDLIRRIATESAVSPPVLGSTSLYYPKSHPRQRTVKLVQSHLPFKARMVIAHLSDLPGKSSRGVARIPVQPLPPPHRKQRQRSKRPRREV